MKDDFLNSIDLLNTTINNLFTVNKEISEKLIACIRDLRIIQDNKKLKLIDLKYTEQACDSLLLVYISHKLKYKIEDSINYDTDKFSIDYSYELTVINTKLDEIIEIIDNLFITDNVGEDFYLYSLKDKINSAKIWIVCILNNIEKIL